GEDGGRPAPGRTIVLLRGLDFVKDSRSTAAGEYEMRLLPPGDFTLIRSPEPGSERAAAEASLVAVPVSVREGEISVVDLGPPPSAASGTRVHGTVSDSKGPLARATITLASSGARSGLRLKTATADA